MIMLALGAETAKAQPPFSLRQDRGTIRSNGEADFRDLVGAYRQSIYCHCLNETFYLHFCYFFNFCTQFETSHYNVCGAAEILFL